MNASFPNINQNDNDAEAIGAEVSESDDISGEAGMEKQDEARARHIEKIAENFERGLHKDPIKQEYKLTKTTRLDLWLDHLKSELRARNLADAMNATI